MNILFVTNRYPTPQTPGDSPCIAQQAQSLRARGHTVDVLWIASQISRTAYITTQLQIWRKLLLGNFYDIVHSHFGWTNAIPAALQWRVPHVVTLRGSDVMIPKQLRVTRPIVRRAAGVITMSAEMRDVLDEPNVHVIPYGIDLNVYQPKPREEARRELGLPIGKPLILFPYAPTRTRKRYDLVEAAMKQLPDDVDVVAIVDKSAEQVASYMSACDVLLLTADWEGSPSAVREALACNMPVVSADVGDVRDYLQHAPSCAIVPHEPTAIADALRPVLAQRPRPHTRPIAAQTGLNAIAERVEKVYEVALAHSRKNDVAVISQWEKEKSLSQWRKLGGS